MKNTLVAIFLLFQLAVSYAQRNKSIAIEPWARWDRYPPFFYVINTLSSGTATASGTSWGIKGSYYTPITRFLYIDLGAGYYRQSFKKIKNHTAYFGTGPSRIINYFSVYDIIFATQRYAYNTIILNVALGTNFPLNDRIYPFIGISFENLLTISQFYKIDPGPPAGPPESRYLRNEKRNFGNSLVFHGGFLKRFQHIYIGPDIIIPIYTRWSEDDVFPTEDDGQSRDKRFSGVGLGLKVCIELKSLSQH